MKFKRNMGRLDQFLRVGIGVLCVYFGFIDPSVIDHAVISAIVGGFGLINLFSAATGYCPVYKLAGITTRSFRQPGEDTDEA